MKHFTIKHLKQLLLIALLCVTSVSHAQTWTPVYSNSLSTTAYSLDIADPMYITFPAQGFLTTYKKELSYLEPGTRNPGLTTYGKNENRFVSVKVNIEPGTYKFSYRLSADSGTNLTTNLFYSFGQPAGVSDYNIVLYNGGVTTVGKTFESSTFDITAAGEYYFGFYFTGGNEGTFYFADFQLSKVGAAVEEYPVTVAEQIQNGTISLYVDGQAITGNVEKGKTVTVEATPAGGFELETITYTVDGGATEDITETKSFEVTGPTVVNATFAETPVEPGDIYTAPTYTNDPGNDFEKYIYRYATEFTIQSKAGTSTWNHDGTRVFYNVLSDFTTDAQVGETITVNFKAFAENKDAGTSEAERPLREDLRWTIATLHIDWNGDGQFDSSEKIAGLTGAEIGTGNDNQSYYGNRDYIYDITKDITIPEGTALGKVRVRLNYTNAWIGNDPISAFAEKSKEGIVYDFDINVVEKQVVTYQVTWATPTNGSIVVKNGVDELTSPATVEEGTVLTIEATADNGYELESITANGTPVEPVEGVYSVTVNADTEIAATFDTTGPKMLDLVVYKGGRQAFWGLTRVYVNEEVKYQEYGQSSQTLQVLEGSTVKVEATEAEPGFAEKYSVVVLVGGEEVALDADNCYEFVMSKETTSITVNYNDPGKKYNYVINKTGEGKVSITVKNTTYEAASGQLTENAEFVVNTEPAEGQMLGSLEVIIGGVPQTGDKYIVTGDIEINVTFVEKTVINYDVTIEKPEFGDLVIDYTQNGELVEIYTYEFEEASKVLNIEENTVIRVSANPEFDYELDAIYPENMEEKVGMQGTVYYEFTLTSNVTIKAVFKPIQYGAVVINQPNEEEGTIAAEFYDSTMDNWYDASWMLDRIEYGTKLRFIVKAAEGYELKEVKKGDEVLTADAEDGNYHVTVEEETITISATFNKVTGINDVNAENAFYNKADQSIYTNNAKVVKVYDLSGRLVLNAENQAVVNVSELADGFYTAVVDDTVIKFNK